MSLRIAILPKRTSHALYLVDRISSLACNESSYVLVCGGMTGTIELRALGNLDLLHTIDWRIHGGISYLGFSTGRTLLFCLYFQNITFAVLLL